MIMGTLYFSVTCHAMIFQVSYLEFVKMLRLSRSKIEMKVKTNTFGIPHFGYFANIARNPVDCNNHEERRLVVTTTIVLFRKFQKPSSGKRSSLMSSIHDIS